MRNRFWGDKCGNEIIELVFAFFESLVLPLGLQMA